MNIVKERYEPVALGVNSTTPLKAQSIGFFMCVTAGTVTISNNLGVAVLSAFPVTAGVYYPMPIFLGAEGDLATIVLAAGASGCLGF